MIRGTRVPIRGLAEQIQAGETMDLLREEYDYVDPARSSSRSCGPSPTRAVACGCWSCSPSAATRALSAATRFAARVMVERGLGLAEARYVLALPRSADAVALLLRPYCS